MAIEPDHTREGGVCNTAHNIWAWRDEHGQLHRVAGPAVIYADGSQSWYQHGKCHRVDGPAVILPSGRHYWYVQGCEITGEVLAWMQANAVTWPFNESQQMEFALRWL
jgi:hypothetical protein